MQLTHLLILAPPSPASLANENPRNFCNLHSLYCNSSEGCPTAGADLTYTESYSDCSQHDNVCVVKKGFYKGLRGVVEEEFLTQIAKLQNIGH